MFKKLLASALSIVMVLTVIMAVSVSADALPENIGTDYVADETTRYSNNIITPGDGGVVGTGWSNPAPTFGFNGAGGAGGMTYGAQGSEHYLKNLTEDVVAAISGGSHPVVGFNIRTTPPEGATGNVLYSFTLRALETPKSVINFARLNTGVASTSASYVEYALEEGIVPTPAAVTYTGTFEDKGVAASKYVYRFGFVGGSEKNAMVWFNSSTAYIGYEYAYDMDVTSDKESLIFGDEMTVEANVLNQLGEEGGLSQDVTWYAVNADRTAEVSGFSIAENEDGTATVAVDSTVETGTYYIVAVADADAKLVKGIPVSVTKKSYTDYVADAEARYSNNMINYGEHAIVGNGWDKPLPTFGFNGAGGAGGMQKGSAGNDSYYFKNLVEDVTATTQNGVPVVGFIVNTVAPEGATGNVVYSFDLRAHGAPEPKSVLNFARANSGVGNTSPNYIEYANAEGFVPATGMQTYTGTFADKGVVASKYVYYFGFVGGTELNAISYFNTATAYIGYEYAYDITASADAESVVAGGNFTVDADILNQIDETGGLSQSVTWYAMNTDRTVFIDGFTFTQGENGTATVSVDSDVAAGTYDMVAVSDADGKLVKGVSVNVENYKDYTPDESTRYSNNMINYGEHAIIGNGWDKPLPTFGFNGAGGAGGIQKGASGSNYYFKNLTDVDAAISGSTAVVGFIINTIPPEGAKGNVLYSFDFRSHTAPEPKSVLNIARVNTGVGTTSPEHVEYAEAEAIEPNGTMQTYTGTFADKGVVSSKYTYSFGFVSGTELNAISYFNPATAYLGYEYGYDIAVKADTESVAAGDSFTVDADVLNQMDKIGGLSQNVTWYAMNTDRTEFVDGFTFTEGENGTATVNVASTVPAGNYDIVAISDLDGKLVKGVTVEVTEEEGIKGITITKTASGITVATDTALTDAQLIFVTYNGGKLVAVNNATKVTLDAQASQGYSIPAGFENAKVMLWSAGFKPLANVLN